MPWFCHATSKKRSSKAKVGGVGRKSGRRKEIERHPTFVVVVKNFTASARDEVSVHRGQVVEVVCTKGNLLYVRDMNSCVGYVPKDCTLNIEDIEGNFINANVSNGGEGTSSGNGNITGPASHPRSIDVSMLQRSGSPVNSVEVHQVNSVVVSEVRDSGEGQAGPNTANTCSESSQAIYEVPRCPDGAAAGPVISEEDERMAPALPPRSSCLPSPADMQRNCAHSHHHHHRPLQRHRPGNLTLSTSANSNMSPCPRHRSRYPYGPFPPTPDNTPCTCHSPLTYSSNRSSVAYTPVGSSRPLPFAQTPGSSSCAPGHPSCTPGCSPPAWTPGASHRTINGISPCGQGQPISRTFSANMPGSAHTPGSAGLPSALAASPVQAHFAPTPRDSSRGMTDSQKVGHGVMISSSSPSSVSPYGQRARVRAQRSRRYSSDLQVHSTISENTSSEASGNRGVDPLGMPRGQIRRQSQPCLDANSASTPGSDNIPRLPQQRPLRLPVRRSLSLHEPSSWRHPITGQSSCPCTPLQQQQEQIIPIRRAPSYQEAVLAEDEKVFGATAGIKPSEMAGKSFTSFPCHPFHSAASTSRGQRSRSGSSRLDSTQSIGASEDVVEVPMCTPDDVFLPNEKKPVGIYRCLRTYKPKFKGEIVLKENEMVIVLDYGRGEWAWVVTSANVEGLVPKSILVKYHSNGNGIIGTRHSDGAVSECPTGEDNDSGRGTITKRKGVGFESQAGKGNFGVDASTQTEAPPMPFRSSSRSASVGLSTGYSTTSVPTNESSPLSTSLRAEMKERSRGRSKKVRDENMILLEAAATAVVEHVEVRTKPCPHTPKEWFNTIDSLDERERIKPCAGSDVCSRKSSTSRLVNSSPTLPDAAGAPETSLSSKDETLKGNATPTSTATIGSAATATEGAATKMTGGTAAAIGTTITEVVRPGTIHYHDRISGLGSASFNDQTPSSSASPRSGKQRSRQLGLSNVLTAIKNYSPPSTAKNCLPIEEGDVLHLQTHMHYPKGWMWVWHTTRRSFGYVPKSYVAYTYNTVKRGRPRADTLEDAV